MTTVHETASAPSPAARFPGIGVDVQHDFASGIGVFDRRVRAAERLGFDAVWLVGGLQRGIPAPLPMLGYAAAATERITLGLAMLISSLRTPLEVARSVTTVDHLAGGRLELGLALGHGGTLYETHGVPLPAHRGHHFDRNVAAIRALLRGEPATLDDPPLRLAGEPAPLPPARPGGPPVWLGGRAPGAIRRAAVLADGWMGAGNLPISLFAPAVGTLRAELEMAGRDPAAFRLGKRVFVGVGADRAAVREKLAAWFAAGPGDTSLVDTTAIYGTADEVASGLTALRASGAQTLALTPLYDVDDQIEILAAEVCPLLADA